MKLLFDENLPPRLVAGLSDVFPGSVHVRDVGLSRATDAAIWGYARDHGLTIVSKDSDFHQVSFLRDHAHAAGRSLRASSRNTLILSAKQSTRSSTVSSVPLRSSAATSSRLPEPRTLYVAISASPCA